MRISHGWFNHLINENSKNIYEQKLYQKHISL